MGKLTAEGTVPAGREGNCQGKAQGLGYLVLWQTPLGHHNRKVTQSLNSDSDSRWPAPCSAPFPHPGVISGLSPPSGSTAVAASMCPGPTLCPFNSSPLRTRERSS